ncbi:NAD-dependent epimerase/dehydratase family protein [Flavobacteriaceae bacterium]|nr:NAD-dependent epimerase/dehydratase family protein [Flavobacteriaceae bacterium]
MNIYLTGASGFVGKNLVTNFNKDFDIKKHIRGSEFLIKQNTVIHLAGKAHDLKNILNKDEYYEVNTELTKQIFDSFLISDSSVFIMLSSVKAVADNLIGTLDEDYEPNPKTHYGKSKLLAEKYILSKKIPNNKRVYILRPCMIHGPNNKGNLNLLYNLVSKRIPWILGSFQNKRSYCSIDNLLFIINELIKNNTIPSGVYNVADDGYLSTNEIISLISNSNNQKPIIFNISPLIVKFIAKIGDIIPLPLNSERLKKLTESYIVSNEKLKKYIAKELPLTSKQGVIKTFKSFKN